MAETIRDVTIRIGLELKKAELRVPDLSSAAGASVADEFERVEKATSTAKEAAEEYDRLVREQLDMQKRAVEAVADEWGEIDESLGELVRSLATIDQLNKKTEAAKDKAEELAEAEKKATEELDKQSVAAEKAGKQLQEIPGRVAQDMEQIAVGAIQAARGFALLSGQNIDELVKIFAKFQGAIDIFRGLGAVTRNIIEGYQRLVPAIQAVTTGNTAMSASNTLVGTTAAGAAVSVRTLLAAAGPYVAIFTAAAAVVGVLTFALRDYKDEAGAATQATQHLQSAVQSIDAPRSFADIFRESASSLLTSNQQLKLAAERLEELRQQRRLLAHDSTEFNIIGGTPFDTQQPLDTLDDLEAFAERAVALTKEETAARVELLQQRKAIDQEIARNELARSNAQLAINEAKREEIELTQRNLETLQKAAIAEEKREQSLRQRLGLQSERDRQIAIRIAERARDEGFEQLTAEQLSRLSGIGIAEAQQEVQRRGTARQAEIEALGFTFAGLAGARDELKRFVDAAGADYPETVARVLQAALKTLNDEDAKLKETTLRIITELSTRMTATEKELQQIQNRVETNLAGI